MEDNAPYPTELWFDQSCMESWPCQHSVFKLRYSDGSETDVSEELSWSPDVIPFCKHYDIPVPVHFEQYRGYGS